MERGRLETVPDAINDLFDITSVKPMVGGHMVYGKCLITTTDGAEYFVKTSDDALLTDDVQAQKMWEYLIKEYYVYDILQREGYEYSPSATMHSRSIVLDALSPDKGWQWEAPLDDPDAYVDDVLQALTDFSHVPAAAEMRRVDTDGSMASLLRNGWNALDKHGDALTRARMPLFVPKLHDHVRGGLDLVNNLLNPASVSRHVELLAPDTQETFTTICHFDARQPNIAWHPDRGVQIVDMSWVDGGPAKADTTMFLIDLHKSGVDVQPYMDEYFDAGHALLLMGYWLARCGLEPPDGELTVRFHQFASAVSAADLLSRR
jgi:hypothetical protein